MPHIRVALIFLLNFFAAHAIAAPAPVGKRALLTVNIQVDGSGQRSVKSDGTDVKWSRRSSFDAKVELAAQKPETVSLTDPKGSAASAGYKAPANTDELEKMAAACKPDDMACQMAVAAKMMESKEVQDMVKQAQSGEKPAARYQMWRAPAAGRAEARGQYKEQWDGVFLTAAREEETCKIDVTAPVGAEQTKLMNEGAKGLAVEIDAQTGKASLMLVVGSYVASKRNCSLNIGGKVTTSSDPLSVVFAAPLDRKAVGDWVAGTAGTGSVLARGESVIDTKPEKRSVTDMLSVTAPLKVKIRWELTAL